MAGKSKFHPRKRICKSISSQSFAFHWKMPCCQQCVSFISSTKRKYKRNLSGQKCHAKSTYVSHERFMVSKKYSHKRKNRRFSWKFKDYWQIFPWNFFAFLGPLWVQKLIYEIRSSSHNVSSVSYHIAKQLWDVECENKFNYLTQQKWIIKLQKIDSVCFWL